MELIARAAFTKMKTGILTLSDHYCPYRPEQNVCSQIVAMSQVCIFIFSSRIALQLILERSLLFERHSFLLFFQRPIDLLKDLQRSTQVVRCIVQWCLLMG